MRPDCKILTHPFQTDPGTSQRQRLLDDLLSGHAQIDARKLADLLDFFVQMSRHVNYYDEQLQVSDWQPFFRKSLPFMVAAIIKYDRGSTEKKLAAYKKRFDNKPSSAGLQLLFSYVCNNIIKKINNWQKQLTENNSAAENKKPVSGLPLETAMEKLIKDKLSNPVKEFIQLANDGTKWFCTKNFSFAFLLENPVWGLTNKDLAAIDKNFIDTGNTKRKRLIALYNKAYQLVQSFFDVIRVLGASAEMSLEQSLLPLKQELKEKHPPHLAILFAFIKLFQYLQGDLNSLTKKHLDHFYKQVLLLKPKEAVPDKLHVVFEIQQQLNQYALKKGLILKDGKDNNKAEIYFATDDEIVVNKAQVADQRTLFLNNKDIDSVSYVEGVYVAPDATKADGIDKDFKDVAVPSRPALGAKWSKFIDPENKFILPYPNARIGFVLASPVLLLNEGTREITITLDCTLNKDYCDTLATRIGENNPCCDDPVPGQTSPPPKNEKDNKCLSPEAASHLYNAVSEALGKTYYYINRLLIAEAVKKGVGKGTIDKLEDLLTITHKKSDPNSEICYCSVDEKEYEVTLVDSYELRFCKYYHANEAVRYNGQTYECTVPHVPQANFVATQWTQVPAAQWARTNSYAVGVFVFHDSKIYRSLIAIEGNHDFKAFQWQEMPLEPLQCNKKYKQDDLILQNNQIYKANAPLTSIPQFDSTKWQPIVSDEKGFEEIFNEPGEMEILKDVFKPRKAFNLLLSGEEDWVAPLDNPVITLTPNFAPNPFPLIPPPFVFKLTITATLKAEEAAVTFYNSETLKEDIKTTLPVAKIELDDKIKIPVMPKPIAGNHLCCLREQERGLQNVSLYHFFRNVALQTSTKIDVKVCGVKSLIVQNDESLQDVNGPVYPFGTRPTVIDFDIKKPLPQPLPVPPPKINLVGPNFYIGSKEVFCKKWTEIDVNLSWKDKPSNFNEYYKGYLVRKNYHDCDDPNDNTKEIYGLNECDFEINLAILENGIWKKEKENPPHTHTIKNKITKDNNRKLFSTNTALICNGSNLFDQSIKIVHNEIVPDPQFNLTQEFTVSNEPLNEFDINTRNGFLRINLQNQDFLHKDYSYVLARQMMAFGRYPTLVNGAVYIQGGIPQVFDISIFFGNIGPKIIEVAGNVVNAAIVGILDELIQIISNKIDAGVNDILLNDIIDKCKNLMDDIANLAGITITGLFSNAFDVNNLSLADQETLNQLVKVFVEDLCDLLQTNLSGIEDDLKAVIRGKFSAILAGIDTSGIFTGFFGEKEVVIPNEPWTPVISSMSIDYTATADQDDIDLIHLYPYAGTYKLESLPQQPTLLPTFCDEGNLFIGLKDLVPGSNVNMLFQLAEATADSETEREELKWYYLENNTWKLLRTGFEVLDDDTSGLTTSGIIKFSLPANMTNENTILPKGLHWIKAAIPCRSKSVSEIISIHTQAIKATFTNDAANDKLRLAMPLPTGSVAKLKEADANVKKIVQPFDSFGGREPEAEKHFYIRTSELLRHKNRAIQKFDYERLVLEYFPKVFKVKCINHSYALNANKFINDFPIAPGYVLIAVIPDLNQLKAAQSFEPRVPVSMLEDIKEYLQKITSPFVRLWIKNPRYEKVNFCLRVKLLPGKDEVYYKTKMEQDLREFLAPWFVGEYDKLTFGQPINRSDVIRFLESKDYLDYIIELKMIHADDHISTSAADDNKQEIVPITPRSILIAGTVDVCINQKDCETWCECKDATGQNKVDCCEHKAIPVNNYCNDQ